MSIFLKMKSWQVFGLIVGVPYGIQAVLMFYFINSDKPDLNVMFTIVFIMGIVCMAVFMFWFWGVGTGLNSFVVKEIRPSSRLFKVGIIYVMSYVLIFTFLLTGCIGKSVSDGVMVPIMPFHLLAMFCMFYGLYFIAKNLVMAEKNQLVTFSDFYVPFFLIWLYPIGIWFIQPRINKLNERISQ